MIKSNLGYVFTCRRDCLGELGIIEAFKNLEKTDKLSVTFTCTVDNAGKLVMPAYNNLNAGFSPLVDICSTDEDLERFLRSNKSFYGKLNECAMIASGSVVYALLNGEVISLKNFGLYVPKTVSENLEETRDSKGGYQPALICDKLTINGGLNAFKVSSSIYNSYLTNIFNQLGLVNVRDKSSFLKVLLGRS